MHCACGLQSSQSKLFKEPLQCFQCGFNWMFSFLCKLSSTRRQRLANGDCYLLAFSVEATKFVASWIWLKFEADEPLQNQEMQCVAMLFSLELVADFTRANCVFGEGSGTNVLSESPRRKKCMGTRSKSKLCCLTTFQCD